MNEKQAQEIIKLLKSIDSKLNGMSGTISDAILAALMAYKA